MVEKLNIKELNARKNTEIELLTKKENEKVNNKYLKRKYY